MMSNYKASVLPVFPTCIGVFEDWTQQEEKTREEELENMPRNTVIL